MIIIKEHKTFSLIKEFQDVEFHGMTQNWFIIVDKQAFFKGWSNFIGVRG